MLPIVHVRNPGGPDEGSGGPGPAGRPDEVAFAVPTRVLAAKATIAGLVAVLALIGLGAGNRAQFVIGLIAALAVCAYALRDVLARVRLRADATGLVAVRGFAGHRRLDWPQVERVRVDSRTRLGARSELLELDAGEEIYLFSRYDLGVDPDEALAALEAVRGSAEG